MTAKLIHGFLIFFAFLMGCAPLFSIAVMNGAWSGFLLTWILGMVFGVLPRRVFRTPMDVPIFFFSGVFVITALLGLGPAKSLWNLRSYFQVIIFYLLLWVADGRYIRWALRGYGVGVLAACFYGLLQFFAIPLLSDFSFFSELSSKTRGYLTLRQGRVHGAVHPLTFAEMLLPGWFFAVSFYLSAKTRLSQTAWLLGAFFVGSILLLTQSRGPWIAALAGFLCLGFWHPKRLRLWPFVSVVALLFLLAPLRERVMTLWPQKIDKSAQNRLDLWQSGLFLAKKHFLTGLGSNQVETGMTLYRDNPDFSPPPKGLEGDLHNLYLQELVEKGVIGLGVLLWLLAMPWFILWRRGQNKSDRSPLDLALASFFPAFFIVNITERAFSDAEVACVYWVMVAVACHSTMLRNGKMTQEQTLNMEKEKKMELKEGLLEILVCPQCHGTLDYPKPDNQLICRSCALAYKIHNGIPVMLVEEAQSLK